MADNRTVPAYRANQPTAAAGAAGVLGCDKYVRLCREQAIIPDENSLIIVGGRQRYRLTSAPEELMLRLSPLLDGGRTAGDIAGVLGMQPAQLLRALSALHEADLVECADEPLNAARAVPQHTAEFLARMARSTGRHRNSREQLDALAAASVLVVAHGPVGHAVRADLRSCGVGQVIGCEPGDLATVTRTVADVTGTTRPLVIMVDEGYPAGVLASAEVACRRHAVPLLRGARQGASIEVGPLFYRDQTACADCFRRGRTQFSGAKLTAGPEPAGPGSIADAAADQVLAAMLTDEAIAVLAHTRTIGTIGTVAITSLASGAERRLQALPYPDCPQCGASFGSSDEADAAAAYEWDVQHIPSELLPPSPETPAYRKFLAELATQRAFFLPGPSYPLPAAAMTGQRSPDGTPEPRLSVSTLATLLARVAGRREPADSADLSRWAPTGGNLASVRLYVAVSGEGLEALSGKLTTYDDLTHRLLAVRAQPVEAGLLLSGTGLQAPEHCLVLAFAADIARIGRKYGSFGYRLAHLDAGVATTQLTVVASQLGLRAVFAPAWDSGLPAVLELHQNDEVVTAVALVTEEEPADGADG
jgi:bacteriocin biosynthesis cyclodehydratase domain-containing protein